MKNCRLYNVQFYNGIISERTEGVIVSAPNAKKAIEIAAKEFQTKIDRFRATPIRPLKNKVVWQYASGDKVYRK